jgi:hypothetical protein
MDMRRVEGRHGGPEELGADRVDSPNNEKPLLSKGLDRCLRCLSDLKQPIIMVIIRYVVCRGSSQ